MPLDDSDSKALLHLNGADTSTTITDESGKTWTARGNAQIDTAQSVFGGASLLLDGTGDQIDTPDSADWFFSAGAFTIDFRVRFAALPGVGAAASLVGQRVDGNNQQRVFTDNPAGTRRMRFRVLSAGPITIDVVCNITLATNTWYHIAVVRTGDDFLIFQDGTQIGSTLTDTSPVPNLAALLEVGGFGAVDYLNGWVDELRVSKGVARWTTNFTPPTSEYAPPVPGGAWWQFA